MDLKRFEHNLFAAARVLPPSDSVPYAFEKRVMAGLNGSCPDEWANWSRLLWRAAAPCVGLTVLMGVWTAVSTHSLSPSTTLAVDLERTVWGPLTALNDSW